MWYLILFLYHFRSRLLTCPQWKYQGLWWLIYKHINVILLVIWFCIYLNELSICMEAVRITQCLPLFTRRRFKGLYLKNYWWQEKNVHGAAVHIRLSWGYHYMHGGRVYKGKNCPYIHGLHAYSKFHIWNLVYLNNIMIITWIKPM